jgi:hypothetical protein
MPTGCRMSTSVTETSNKLMGRDCVFFTLKVSTLNLEGRKYWGGNHLPRTCTLIILSPTISSLTCSSFKENGPRFAHVASLHHSTVAVLALIMLCQDLFETKLCTICFASLKSAFLIFTKFCTFCI